jgi:hypothetical protein
MKVKSLEQRYFDQLQAVAADRNTLERRIREAGELLDRWEQYAVKDGEYERHSDRPDAASRINELRIALSLAMTEEDS